MADMQQAGQTPRLSALQQLAGQLPVANQRLAQQQQAARDMQLQQTVKAIPPQAAGTQAAQQAGAIAAQNAGQQLVQNATNQMQSNAQLGQLGLQEQGRDNAASLGALQLGAKDQTMDNVQKLAQISDQAKQEMYDSRLKFTRDQSGQEFLNQRQLDDFAAMTAKSNENFANYSSQQEQVYKRKVQMMDQANQLLSQKLQSEAAVARQLQAQATSKDTTQTERSNAQKLYDQKAKQLEDLTQQQNALKISIAQEQADAANRAARKGAIGSVIGAVAGGVGGAILGGPVGASAGASAGSALGGGIAAAT